MTHLSSGLYDFVIPLTADAAVTGTISNHISGSHAIRAQGRQYLLKPCVPSTVGMYAWGLLKEVAVYEKREKRNSMCDDYNLDTKMFPGMKPPAVGLGAGPEMKKNDVHRSPAKGFGRLNVATHTDIWPSWSD